MKVVALLALLLVASARNPGLSGSVDQATLNTAFTLAAGIGMQLAPGNYGNYTTDVKYSIFDLHVIITDITLISVTYDEASSGIQLESPNFFIVNLVGIEVKGQANYDTKMGLAVLKGVATVDASGINVNANVTVTASSTGMPQLTVNSASATIGSVTVTSSLPSDLNSFINSEIKKEISTLQADIPSLIAKYIPQVNTLLNTFSTVVPIQGTDLAINCGLTQDPLVINNQYIAGGIDGTVFNTKTGEPADEPAAGLPWRTSLNEGFQGLASDFAITQALANVAPLFAYTLTALPANAGLNLDTNALSIIIPELDTFYGSDPQPMNLKVYYDASLPAPEFSTNNGVATVSGTISIDNLVNDNNAGFKNAVTLQVAFTVTGTASLSGTAVKANIASYTIDSVTAVNSAIGTVDTSGAATNISDAVGTFIPMINGLLANIPVTFPSLPYSLSISADDVMIQTGYVAAGVTVA